MTRLLACLLVLSLPIAPRLRAQVLPDAVASHIDAVFEKVSTPNAPGCALGVYRYGELAYAMGYGMADLEHDVAVAPNSVFDLGSTSKQFTAASLILLEQQGALSLDDDVRKYIPELPDYGHTITLRTLLNHTSGLRDYIDLLLMAGFDIDDVATADHTLDIVTRQRSLNFEPGSEHAYSNTGYFLLSLVVERASGQTLRKFASEHLFGPLGMTSTTYIDDHTELVPRRAVGYRPGPGGEYHRDISYWEQNGDGAVFSTVEDLLLWDRNFYEPAVGGEALVSELLRRGVLTNGDTISYGQGLYFDEYRGRETVAHAGAWGGYRAQFVRVPSDGLTLAVLCNSAHAAPDEFAEGVLDVLLGGPGAPDVPRAAESVQKTTDSLSVPRPDAYIGHYRDANGTTFEVSREANELLMELQGSRTRLHPLSDSLFVAADLDVRFKFHVAADAQANGGVVLVGGGIPFERYQPWSPSEDQLQSYAGRYYSPELDTVYSLSVHDGVLVLSHKHRGSEPLQPVKEGSFSSGYLGTIDFGAEGATTHTSFQASSGRVAGLAFQRVD